jgi:hypothetical protein
VWGRVPGERDLAVTPVTVRWHSTDGAECAQRVHITARSRRRSCRGIIGGGGGRTRYLGPAWPAGS